MKLSACLIVKNEERNIKRCIESFKTVVDEIIVVDTGSEDTTIEIAKKLGGKIYHYKWENDFSKARNYALDKATGDWIIFLDADEYFYENKANNIRKIIRQIPNGKINAVLTRHVNIDACNNRIKNTEIKVRIFKNNKNIRYAGKIHENVNNNGKALNAIAVAGDILEIYHVGYSSDIIIRKSKRNLELLLDSLRHSRDPMIFFYLADCYMILAEYEYVIKYARLFIENPTSTFGYDVKPYQNLICSMIKLEYSSEDTLKEINNAINKFPKHPEFYRELGDVYYKQSRYTEALNAYLKSIELHKNYDDVEYNNVESIKFKIYYAIGLLYSIKNEQYNALAYYVYSLKENTHYEQSFYELLKIIKDQNTEDIIILLKDIYDVEIKEDIAFLVCNLSNLKLGKVLLYFNDIWRKKYGQEDSGIMFTLLANHRYNESFDLFSKCYITACSNWTALYSVISALLSDNLSNINYIKNVVKPSYKRIIEAYVDENSIGGFINEDLEDYKNILIEYILIADDDKLLKMIKLKNKFSQDISETIGDLLREKGKYSLAIDEYNKMIKNDNYNKRDIYFKIGLCNYKLHDYENARASFENSVEFGYINNDIKELLSWIK